MPLLLYFAISMPFRICFAGPTPAWEVGVDILFILDLGLNFRTGYFISTESDLPSQVEYDRYRVARNYIR